VDDSPIVVEPFYKQQEPIVGGGNIDALGGDENTAAQKPQQSVSQVMAQLLASGYVLTESVINKGAEFDKQHGVSTKVNGYLNKVGINLTNLNSRFHGSSGKSSGTSTATTDDNNDTQARSNTQHQPSRMQNIMKSRAGLKVQGIASSVANKVSNVHEEAKRLAVSKLFVMESLEIR
jgi:hypothetical protein